MVVRPFVSESDRAAVERLLSAATDADGFPPLGESKFVDYRGPGNGIGLVAEAGGELVGYAHLLHHAASEAWELEIVFAPHQRTLDVVEGMLDAARPHVQGRLLWWVFGTQSVELAEQAGAEVLRELHKLRGPLPASEQAEVPSWAEIRAFRRGVDEEAWLVANNAAFAGHLENGNWNTNDLRQRLDRDWFSDEGFRLAWAGERVAGFCWTKLHTAELGEIYVVAVHPDYQGKGLGRAIVIEAMEYLAGVGCRDCILYVDTSNPSALELYRSLGFELERVDRCVVVPNG